MIGLVIVALVLFVLVGWRRARRVKQMAAHASLLNEVMGTTGAFRGHRWKVGDPKL